jgi:hypothetical protein
MEYLILIKESTYNYLLTIEGNEGFMKKTDDLFEGKIEVSIKITPENFKYILDIFYNSGYNQGFRERVIAC